MPYAIEGLEQTLRALRKFSPELYKEMNKEIRPELKAITTAAKNKLPAIVTGLTNFNAYRNQTGESKRKFPIYNASDARRGITFSTGAMKANRNGWVNRYVIWNKNAAAAILETAGRKNPDGQPWAGKKGAAGHKYSHSNNRNAGTHFIKSANNIGAMKRVGQGPVNQGRIIFAAVEENQGRAKRAIEQAVIKACAKFNAGLIK